MEEKKKADLQNEELPRLYEDISGLVAKKTLSIRNAKKSWDYGYNKEYDIVVISKTGEIGQIIDINGVKIALPKAPVVCKKRSSVKSEQYWEPEELPAPLAKIKTIFQWKSKSSEFKNMWMDYINEQFNRREGGFWFMNNGRKTYITGSHWMYLQWSNIDVGLPQFREANRVLYIYWEAAKADSRSFGINYLKIRRSGFSFMGSAECVNIGTLAKNAHLGMISKTGADAKELFVNKVVPISTKYPFFFKPIQDGMDKPKTELLYQVPASRITKKNMYEDDEVDEDGLNTAISWKNTADNAYDSMKLVYLLHDETGKWLLPNTATKHWSVAKTCLRLGQKVIGKCMMGSTCNSMKTGGESFKKLFQDSDPRKRNKNGRTKTGLYALFIPMEWNTEGFIDRHGMPVLRTPEEPVLGVDGEYIYQGAIDWWENEVDGLKGDSDALNEFYRQNPRTEAHAFRDEAKNALFNLTKIYQQIDFNESSHESRRVSVGNFIWKDGIKDSKVIWAPNPNGRFKISWFPPASMQNNVRVVRGRRLPGNEHIGAFGCDSYDISGTVGGGGSNGALHGKTGMHTDNAPINSFFLEYVARPKTAEIFFEDVLMALVFYGMPILAENNKPRLLYHLKNRGYRGFSISRPDKPSNKLSKTERELGGMPNSSEDIKQMHASAIESYIEQNIGYDEEGLFRDPGDIGDMPFNRTLSDWANFDINNRTKFDASISSGLAIIATQRHMYVPASKQSKISFTFARYSNDGRISEIIND